MTFIIIIKTYESNKNQLKVGDVVVCINDDNQMDLELNHKYIVTKVYHDDASEFCNVKEPETGIDFDYGFFTKRFIPEMDYDINRYNL